MIRAENEVHIPARPLNRAEELFSRLNAVCCGGGEVDPQNIGLVECALRAA